MYQILLPNNTYAIIEDYEDEIKTAFEKADLDAGDTVDVLYFTDSLTHDQLEIWRKDHNV